MINDIPIILVGNKLDEANNEENGRLIEYSEGEAFAKDNQFQFLEASALNGTNIDEVFNNISELIIKNLEEERPSTITDGTQLSNMPEKPKKDYSDIYVKMRCALIKHFKSNMHITLVYREYVKK